MPRKPCVTSKKTEQLHYRGLKTDLHQRTHLSIAWLPGFEHRLRLAMETKYPTAEEEDADRYELDENNDLDEDE